MNRISSIPLLLVLALFAPSLSGCYDGYVQGGAVYLASGDPDDEDDRTALNYVKLGAISHGYVEIDFITDYEFEYPDAIGILMRANTNGDFFFCDLNKRFWDDWDDEEALTLSVGTYDASEDVDHADRWDQVPYIEPTPIAGIKQTLGCELVKHGDRTLLRAYLNGKILNSHTLPTRVENALSTGYVGFHGKDSGSHTNSLRVTDFRYYTQRPGPALGAFASLPEDSEISSSCCTENDFSEWKLQGYGNYSDRYPFGNGWD